MNIVLPVDNPKFRALIFDFDGLLVDSETVWEQVERALLARHGAEYDPLILNKYIGTGLVAWSAAIVNEYQLSVAPDQFGAELMEMIVPELERSAEPMPGAIATVAAAHEWGGPVAIASSSSRPIVETVVQKLAWDRMIPVRCTGDEVAHTKPAPDLFLLAAARLGVAPKDCLVLEDSVNGARAAHAAGMTCIAVPNPAYRPAQFEGFAAHIAPSLEALDIRAWLE
jgi:HAD superfamily hydrolase (TIGR01509 family)